MDAEKRAQEEAAALAKEAERLSKLVRRQRGGCEAALSVSLIASSFDVVHLAPLCFHKLCAHPMPIP